MSPRSSHIPVPDAKKRAALRRALLAWFRKNARDLPWRRTKDPYAIWLSEIMLQQTRVEQGLPYYERFIAAFPTVQALAQAKEDEVLKLWEGLGYYSRARNLHKAAKHVAFACNNELPRMAAHWLELPGVGRYTAGAIASIAFGERTAVVDGNVIRVLSRLFNVDDCTDETATREQLWTLAESLVPPKHPGDFNEALMELGATICTPKNPMCEVCPVARLCAARALGVETARPVRRSKKPTPHREHVAAAIAKGGRYLIVKRASKGLLGGLWEFPGGDVASGETHETAIKRIIGEQTGLRVRAGGPVASVDHAYSHFRVTVHVYACQYSAGKVQVRDHIDAKWVWKSHFSRYAFPKTHHKFLDQL
jgi:A/G-specific adenine glycosylase